MNKPRLIEGWEERAEEYLYGFASVYDSDGYIPPQEEMIAVKQEIKDHKVFINSLLTQQAQLTRRETIEGCVEAIKKTSEENQMCYDECIERAYTYSIEAIQSLINKEDE